MKSLKNIIKIQITGINRNRFLNLLCMNKIELFNVRSDSKCITAYMNSGDFFKIKNYVWLTKVRVVILKKYGFAFFIKKHRRRYFFILGTVLFFTAVALSNTRIKKISIRGNNYYSRQEIYKFLTDNDIDYNIKKRAVSCKELEKKLLDNFELLTFVSVSVDNTSLNIVLKENDTKNPAPGNNTPYNIIATKSGVIHSIITRSGIPLVKEGDTVNAGDVLVKSRLDFIKFTGENYGAEDVMADADILIRTTDNYKKVLNRKYEAKHFTGNTVTRSGIKIGDYYKRLPGKKCDFKLYDIETTYKTEKYDYKNTPVTYFFEKYKEYELITCEYSDEELKELATNEINKYIENLERKSFQILDKSVKIDIYGESAVIYLDLVTLEPAFEKKGVISDECN